MLAHHLHNSQVVVDVRKNLGLFDLLEDLVETGVLGFRGFVPSCEEADGIVPAVLGLVVLQAMHVTLRNLCSNEPFEQLVISSTHERQVESHLIAWLHDIPFEDLPALA